MKQFLIIGLDDFGHILCRQLAKTKCEIMIADSDPTKLDDLLDLVVSAKSGDCTHEAVLRSFGIPDFDVCFVCIGNDFLTSLQVTSLLKELGAKKVISKANEEIQAKFLLRNGADQIIYPEYDIAERIAIRESSDKIFDAIELTDGFAIYEILPQKKWLGKSLRDMDFRKRYNLTVLAIKKEEGGMILPMADDILMEGQHIVVFGMLTDIQRISV